MDSVYLEFSFTCLVMILHLLFIFTIKNKNNGFCIH